MFYNPQHVITAIRHVCSLLEVPRRALGITCASRCVKQPASTTMSCKILLPDWHVISYHVWLVRTDVPWLLCLQGGDVWKTPDREERRWLLV